MDSQSYSTADEEEHVEPAIVYQEEGMKFSFYDCMTCPSLIMNRAQLFIHNSLFGLRCTFLHAK